jgi:hypothetical protein
MIFASTCSALRIIAMVRLLNTPRSPRKEASAWKSCFTPRNTGPAGTYVYTEWSCNRPACFAGWIGIGCIKFCEWAAKNNLDKGINIGQTSHIVQTGTARIQVGDSPAVTSKVPCPGVRFFSIWLRHTRSFTYCNP